MTYLELYEDALRKLHNSLITLGEFEMMVKPLNREVEAEPTTDAVQETVPTVVRVTMSDGSQYYLESGDSERQGKKQYDG